MKSLKLFRWKSGLFLLVSIMLMYGLIEEYFYTVKAITPSNEHTYFIFKKNKPNTKINVGDYVHFYHPKLKIWIVKKVVGRAGDTVHVQERQLIINSCAFETKEQDSMGINLQVNQATKVPTHMFFVAGTHQESFDSRYQDFGFVSLNQIKGVGVGIL